MVENPYEYERKQKRKIVIVTIAMVAIILALLVWVIIAAVNSTNGKKTVETHTSEQIPVDQKSNNENPLDNKNTENSTPQNTVVPEQPAPSDMPGNTDSQETTTTTTATPEATPTTGPVDTTLTALLAGVSVYLATNLLISRKRATRLA